MDKDLENKLKEILEEQESIEQNNDFTGVWAILLLALMFGMPKEKETPVINIYIGSDY